MTPQPNGRLLRTAAGRDLVLTRNFRAPIEDVWASVTESERTARWYGSWEGDAGPGRTIKVRMLFEENQPIFDMHIDTCEPPRHLILRTTDDLGEWVLEAVLIERSDGTELTFTQHLAPGVAAADVGPGWEYYLDAWVAAEHGAAQPSFDDYYPSMKPYYEQQEQRV
ncbi:SRPBCC family protein [Nocardia otitidiscaviarum]|uniref:SRPBCC family protein n=1 Tax=Nocardia otitidiscaviarum TaxID=1823 RepID=UPI001894FD94|nr:SRPBCC family protein [Nocardia otitidiscaviarum]MBF6182190.1 SRPBCC family protein [Nocardia otitidiscaviarum]